MQIRATPFHASASSTNRFNRWQARNGWALAADYGDAHKEAISARINSVLVDISWRSRLSIEGPRAEEFLRRLVTRDPAKLAPGQSFKALWLNDGGGIRGAGAIARYGRGNFRIVSTVSDFGWIEHGAALFDVEVRMVDGEQGGLAVIGPYARHVLDSAGLDGALEPLGFRKLFWRGLEVTLSRFGEHGGYEVWCATDDGGIVWDRLMAAGSAFALQPAGLDALDVLDLEAGVPRPGRDYESAVDGFAAAPSPFELGLESLIEEDHRLFNGRSAVLKTPRTSALMGVEFAGEDTLPHAPLFQNGRLVGRTRSSLYSAALRRSIALATVEMGTSPGAALSCNNQPATICTLPFLPTPGAVSS
jgi:aminomethyltransferase